MSKAKVLSHKYFRLFWLIVITAVVVYLIAQNISVFGKLLLVVLGFGAVVLVHEFDRFFADPDRY